MVPVRFKPAREKDKVFLSFPIAGALKQSDGARVVLTQHVRKKSERIKPFGTPRREWMIIVMEFQHTSPTCSKVDSSKKLVMRTRGSPATLNNVWSSKKMLISKSPVAGGFSPLDFLKNISIYK